jgi:hypothetical protein
VVAPAGTLVEIAVLELTVSSAGTPLKVTLVAPVRLFPNIVTGVSSFPERGAVGLHDDRLRSRPESRPVETWPDLRTR